MSGTQTGGHVTAGGPSIPMGVELRQLLDIARAIAAEAGTRAAKMRSDGISVETTKSNQLDIVTQADTAVEALIRRRLATTRPHDGILGEEGGVKEGTSGITWIVDPIDGTVNYLYGSPYYAVSIAATVADSNGGRTAVVGCVYAPALGSEYTAALGQPALLNGSPIHVNEHVPLDRALVSTGFNYDIAKRQRTLHSFNALMSEVRDFRLNGAAALEICGVAEGRIDVHFQRNLPIWDYAAAALIAGQAGARVSGAGGAPPSADLLLVGHAPLAAVIEAHLH